MNNELTPSQNHALANLPDHAKADVMARYEREQKDPGLAILLALLFHAPWIYCGKIGQQIGMWFLIGLFNMMTVGFGLLITVPTAAVMGVKLVKKTNEETMDRLILNAKAMTAGGMA